MYQQLLAVLRCPFCSARLSLLENYTHVSSCGRLESGVLGCDCCTFPVVAGIPVMVADDQTREVIKALKVGRRHQALFMLLGLDEIRADAFRSLLARGARATYREAIAILSPNAEGAYFVYRFSDPSYLSAEELLQDLGQSRRSVAARSLDLCGGSGHLTRVLSSLRSVGKEDRTGPHPVLADLYFWKLWLAKRFTSPECAPVCCDANQPLPFSRDAFSMVVLADAFPYIWQKRLLADEMMRLTEPDGVVVMPHLHSALGENISAGDTLTPSAYRNLFAPRQPRLFSDERLLTDLIERRGIDLTRDSSSAELGDESSLTLIASRQSELFRRYRVQDLRDVDGELKVNPLYRVERRAGRSILTLVFPTAEYEEEFFECRRYLPDTITLSADLSGQIVPSTLGLDYEELRRRRILIDAPLHYC